MPPEKLHWAHLYDEVVTSGLCTGCSACVVVCPYDVLGYDDADGRYKPFHVARRRRRRQLHPRGEGLHPLHPGVPALPDLGARDRQHLFGRERTDDEVSGIAIDIVLARATDPELHQAGQDGGFVSALLVWALEHDMIDAALVSALEGDGTSWKAVPAVARTRAEVLATAGSRYTYSANPMAYAEAIEGGAERIALVGMGCQASAPPVMAARKAGKVARRFTLSIGLLCSKTFDDAIFPELFEARYGLAREDIVKMNIKGVFQLWTRDGGYHEIPLKEAHAWTREGCNVVPGLRRRARRHLDRRHRGLQRLDPHHRPHRAGPRAVPRHGGRRRGGGAPGRRRPRGGGAPAPAQPGQPQAVAGHRRADARPAPRHGLEAGRGAQAPSCAGPGEHRVEHRLGERAGEGVLLARVVGAQQRPAVGQRVLGQVAEPRPRAAARAAPPATPQANRPRATTTRAPVEERQLPAQVGQALVPFGGGGRVVRRGAAHRGRDPRAPQHQPVVRPSARRAGWRSRPATAREQPVARAVAGEDPPGAVGAVGRGRQAHHHQAGARVAEARRPGAPQ